MLISILQTTTGLAANKFILADGIDEISGGQVIEKHIGIEYETKFLAFRA